MLFVWSWWCAVVFYFFQYFVSFLPPRLVSSRLSICCCCCVCVHFLFLIPLFFPNVFLGSNKYVLPIIMLMLLLIYTPTNYLVQRAPEDPKTYKLCFYQGLLVFLLVQFVFIVALICFFALWICNDLMLCSMWHLKERRINILSYLRLSMYVSQSLEFVTSIYFPR